MDFGPLTDELESRSNGRFVVLAEHWISRSGFVRCPYCQTEAVGRTDNCKGCGRALPAQNCPLCGFGNSRSHKFCSQCGAPLGVSEATVLSAENESEAYFDVQSERRQVTILFSDLVGSTQLSTRMDPEDFDALIRAYQKSSAEIIERFGGNIAQYQGDGILAYFGYPAAHENDPERAVHAGLGIVQRIQELEVGSGLVLAVRVGIATGLVVVSSSSRDNRAYVAGETPNLAARLLTLAAPNSTVIASSTRRLVGSLFEYEALGAHEVKGFAEPVPLFRVIRERSVGSRFRAVQAAALTPLVGRREELALLRGRWTQAKRGDGEVVLLVGEAGIGKSRIVEALHQSIADEEHTLLRYQCSPHFTNSALHPVIAQIERMAQIQGEDTARDKLDKLTALLADYFEDISPIVSLFAALLFIPIDAGYRPLPADPKQQKDRTLAALVQLLDAIAARHPTLIIIEDAHWIDPTSLEWLTLVVDWIPRTSALVVMTSRPEFLPNWANRSQLTLLTLNRLNRPQSFTMLRELAGEQALSDEVVEQIVAKADGIPLYLEEIARVVVESDAAAGPEAAGATAGARREFAIPATLQDSLMARLDQLGDAKEIAQICSAIGREFSYELLAAVAPLPEVELSAMLEKLVAARIVLPRGASQLDSYVFKHGLLQDAAYESILRRKRQELHSRLADVLVARFATTAEARPELVAYHFSAANRPGEAVRYWDKAGRRAVARSANTEAVRHFMAALEQLEKLPSGVERWEKEFGLRIVLGPALINTRGPLSAEVQQNYARAQSLAAQLPETGLHFAANWGVWRITQSFVEKQHIADDLQRLAGRLNDDGLLLQAHHTQWATQFHLGRHEDCLRHVDEGLAIYTQADYSAQATVYGGHDPKVCGCGEAAFSLWLTGRPEASLARSGEALAWAEKLQHAGTMAHALDMGLLLQQYRRDPGKVMELSEDIIDFAMHENFPVHKAKGLVFKGWATAHLDHPRAGLELIRSGLEPQQNVGTREDFPIFFDMLAEVLSMNGEISNALQVIDEALSDASLSGLRYWTAELYRRKAELLLHDDRKDDAETNLLQAHRVAQRQGATALELRAAMGLARLWADAGRDEEARQLLAGVLGRFGEGLETTDLKQAASLLQSFA